MAYFPLENHINPQPQYSLQIFLHYNLMLLENVYKELDGGLMVPPLPLGSFGHYDFLKSRPWKVTNKKFALSSCFFHADITFPSFYNQESQTRLILL